MGIELAFVLPKASHWRPFVLFPFYDKFAVNWERLLLNRIKYLAAYVPEEIDEGPALLFGSNGLHLRVFNHIFVGELDFKATPFLLDRVLAQRP